MVPIRDKKWDINWMNEWIRTIYFNNKYPRDWFWVCACAHSCICLFINHWFHFLGCLMWEDKDPRGKSGFIALKALPASYSVQLLAPMTWSWWRMKKWWVRTERDFIQWIYQHRFQIPWIITPVRTLRGPPRHRKMQGVSGMNHKALLVVSMRCSQVPQPHAWHPQISNSADAEPMNEKGPRLCEKLKSNLWQFINIVIHTPCPDNLEKVNLQRQSITESEWVRWLWGLIATFPPP